MSLCPRPVELGMLNLVHLPIESSICKIQILFEVRIRLLGSGCMGGSNGGTLPVVITCCSVAIVGRTGHLPS